MLVSSCSHPLWYCSQCVLLGPWLHGVCGRDVIFLMFGMKVSVLFPVSIGLGTIGSGGVSSGGVV